MINDYIGSIFPESADISGYVAVGPPRDSEFFSWPSQRVALVEYCNTNKDSNVYIVPALYGEPGSRRANNISHRWVACVDSGRMSIDQFRIPPTAVVRTSQGRHQAYWRCSESNPKELVKVSEAIARKHNNDGHDISAWEANHLFRVPGTTNERRGTQAYLVSLTSMTYTLDELMGAYPVE